METKNVIIPRVYVTKYALTTGISAHDNVVHCVDTVEAMIGVTDGGYTTYFHRPDWYTDLAQAEARAEEMRLAKIASIEKQLKKLRAMKFVVTG